MLRERAGCQDLRPMARSRGLGVLGVGLATATLLAVPATAATAATVTPASLKITVLAKVHPGQNYQIKIAGSYQPSQLQGTAYLWAFLQYGGHACKPTAQAEAALSQSAWSLDVRRKEPRSPFTRIDNWTAGALTGARHVCAYLYPKVISKSSTVRPIATASAAFRNV
jgi:hypothetical protein